MKIYTRIEFDWDGNILSEVSYDYHGPLALCYRQAVSEARNLEKQAGTVAGEYGQSAQTEGNIARGFEVQNLTSPQGFGQSGVREMLTSALAGTGGGSASITGQAALEAARRRNTGGFGSALDEAARIRERNLAGTGEKVAAADVGLKQQQRQDAAKGLEGMYGIDTSTMMKSMGLQDEAIKTQIDAQKSGWFQNLMKGISTVAGSASAVMGRGGAAAAAGPEY